MNALHIENLPWREQTSPSGRFRSFCRDVSLALGGIRNVGTWGGGHPFDFQIRRIPPGAAICPLHAHLNQWELFVVMEGEGCVRLPNASHAVATGEVFMHLPAECHQLTNTGSTDLVVYIIADNPQLDGFYYPESAKWGLRPPGFYFRAQDVPYLEGEEPAPAGGFDLAPPPELKPAVSFRKLHPDTLPWVPWQSPKGKFRGTSKELSIALGAKRNTPTGLGGHPFDLELSKLEPGLSGCPFHSHSSQWELFVFLRGTATVRAGDATHTFRAGDAVLHPPGEAHQLTNGGADELVFFLITDNPPVDVWHYPDSNKWGSSTSGKYFNATTVDYWAGEE